MRAEVSCLFRLEEHDVVKEEVRIGSDIRLQEIISNNWRHDLLTSKSATAGEDWRWLVRARQRLDWGVYTHRLYISLDGVTGSDDPRIAEAKQLIMRSIILSRVVHPTPIALGGVWIETIHEDSEEPHYRPAIGVGFYGRAYVSPNADSEKTLTRADAARIAELWEPLQRIFNHEEKYRRIIRALKFFDGGYHISIAEFRHVVFHSALSALICTGRESIKAQFSQRLPRLVPEITERQAIVIHNLYDDIARAATPLQLKMVDGKDLIEHEQSRPDEIELVADNQERFNAVLWLEKSLRLLLERAIADQTFADLLADGGEFARQYPVEIKKSSIGDFIIRDQGVRGGRPIIDGTGITVNRIATWYNMGLRPEEIAGRIGHLSLAQVYAALAHYHANRDEIDAEIAAEEVEADRLEQEHLSLQSR
jgi:uncharacterized protein (DUF433 family)